MQVIAEWKIADKDSRLMVSGVPIVAGRVFADSILTVTHGSNDQILPSWWQPRAFWQDGSVKWIMLHVRLAETGTDSKDEYYRLVKTGSDGPAMKRNEKKTVVVFPDDNGFHVQFAGEDEQVQFKQELMTSAAKADGTFRIEMLEDSPVAPLYLLSNEQDNCCFAQYLLRIDARFRTLYLTCRYVWNTETDAIAGSIKLDISLSPGLLRQSRIIREQADDRSAIRSVRGNVSVVLEDGRRRGPCSIAADRDSANFRVFLLEDEDGMPLSGGTSFRQNICVSLDRDLSIARPVFNAGYISQTGALGQVADINDPYLQYIAAGCTDGLKYMLDYGAGQINQDLPIWQGIENDGDWPLDERQYGANGYRAYADNEYDAAYAFYLAYAAANMPEYQDIARRCSVHMTDIDMIYSTGDMRYHGYNEEAEDHRRHRVKTGDLGHYWSDGLWLAYFWFGDVFALTAARRLMRWVIGQLPANRLDDAFAICERNLGWPLLLYAAELETGLADREVLEFGDMVIGYLEEYFRDPSAYISRADGPVWWRCALNDGCKPFMLGVLCEALERIFLASGRSDALNLIQKISSFIMERLYDPVRIDFEYEQNAYGPGHRHINAQHLIPLFIRGLLFTAVMDKDWSWRKEVLSAFHACTWSMFTVKNGKDIALITRGLLPALATVEKIYSESAAAYIAQSRRSHGRSLIGWRSETSQSDFIFPEGIYTDSGVIRIDYKPKTEAADGLNRQAFFYAGAGTDNKSAFCVLAFYNRLQARFYDSNARIINSLDCFVEEEFFQPGHENRVKIKYSAPGKARLFVNGKKCDEIDLNRALSGAFTTIMVGRKPGNWQVNGDVEVSADFLMESDL